MKALLLKRTSEQGEIELQTESTKLKSKSDFWRHFRVSYHARCSGTVIQSHIFTVFCSHFVGLFDAGGESRNMVYAFHRFMLVSTV